MSETPELGDLLRSALPTYEAPESLRAFARMQTTRELGVNGRQRPRLIPRLLVAASLIATFAAGWWTRDFVKARASAHEDNGLAIAVVDTHVRSLMSGHVIDVASSDRHTVKPWFAGKVPLAPPVPDLAGAGFPLLGGRVESVAGHAAAAIIYGHARHTVTLLVWTTPELDGKVVSSAFHGYNVVHWTAAGLAYWAVSDIALGDLLVFSASYRQS